MRNLDRKLGIGFVIVWVVGALFSLALTGAVIYVAIHFIAKWW
jgi:hypothetical protein